MSTRGNIEDIYPLTPMQEGMLFHSLSAPSSSGYFDQISYRLHGELDAELVKKSINQLFKRYDILRTAFIYEGVERPVQVVLKKREVDFCYRDLGKIVAGGPAEKEAYIKEFKNKDRERSFDLSRDVTMRVALLQIDEKEYEFIWSHHHILMDGWCTGILIEDYFELYNAYLENRNHQLAKVTPYRVYIQWLEKQDREKSSTYWRHYLESYEEAAGIPGKNIMTSGRPGYENERVFFDLDSEKTAHLGHLAAGNSVTLNTIIQAAWGITLARYNGKEDVVFGAVVSGRPHEIPGVESMVGLFINTVPVRIRAAGKTRFNELLRTVQQAAVDSEPHHYYPLAEIQAHTTLKQNLLDHILVFENFPLVEKIDGVVAKSRQKNSSTDLRLTRVEVFEQTNYEFNMIIVPGDRISIRFLYNGNTYERNFVERIARHFTHVIDQILNNEEITTGELTLLTGEEKRQLLSDFNDTRGEYPENQTIWQLVEEQAAKVPDGIALVGRGAGKGEYCALTYKALNKKSNRLARMLLVRGVGPDFLVGLLMDRSPELVTGMLAIMKAGGAYLPLDPGYPQERILAMIEDSGVSLLLTTTVAARDFSFTSLKSVNAAGVSRVEPVVTPPRQQIKVPDRSPRPNRDILFVDQLSAKLAGFPGDNTQNIGRPGDLVYVIYTSGSTGKPKGVMLEHRNLVNLLWYNHNYTNIDYSSVLQFASISFDASFQEIFFTLAAGGKLLVIHEELRTDIPRLFAVVTENKIRTLFLPISLLKIIFSEKDYIMFFPRCVIHIQTAGEQVVISKGFAKYLHEHQLYLHNHYGPAETHVVTAYTVNPAGEIPELPPIGKPILNTGIYILDPGLELQPIGVPGELYISGIQVGRGYLDRPELTAERFCLWRPGGRFLKKLPPWSPHKNFLLNHLPLTTHHSPIYHTGDLAKWLPDGNIDFLGRIDHQVKIRGFRIEPGEIESRLIAHPLVKETVVIPFEKSAYGIKKGEKFLCAYIVPESNATPTAVSGVRAYLTKILPDYMIPSYFVTLAKIPLTPNGKVNRQALPEPAVEGGGEYTAPRSKLEKKLLEIWSKVLGIDNTSIGIDSNFFQLGGHSLKAIILVSRIKKECKVEFSLSQVFQGATIRKFAEIIKNAGKTIYEEIKPVEKREYYPQSSSQKRLFFLDQYENIGTSYNLPLAFEIRGKLEKERCENAFKMLIGRHESLRTSFALRNNEPLQRVHDPVAFKLEEIITHKKNSADDPIREIIQAFTRPFDLSNAPLLRAALVPLDITARDSYLLLFDMHHIISDGTSFTILITDFITLYAQREVRPIKIQYKDFSLWQHNLVRSGKIKEQEDYWLDLYRGEIPRLNLPLDFPRPKVLSFAGDSYDFKLPATGASRFKDLVSASEATLYMGLLTVLNILLYKYTGQEDIITGCGIVGRPHVDLQAIIGMFVNTLAMRNYPAPGKTFRQFLNEVKENSIKAFENQDVPFEDLVDKLNPVRNPARPPLFDVLFVLQNFEAAEWQTGDVSIVPYVYESNTSKFDITLTAFESKDEIFFNLEYCSTLFSRDTCERMARHFIKILEEINKQPANPLVGLEILSPGEKKVLLEDFNATAAPYPRDKTIHELFEHQVEKTTDHVAIPNKISITYRELNKQSRQLAYLLQKKGVRAEEIVAIMGDRSLEMIIGILAILKAGAAYMPIDPEYPRERINYMLGDSKVNILIEKSDLSGESTLSSISTCRVGPANLAYIMYTSGSSGSPKGVMVRHGNVVRLVKSANYVELSEKTRILQTGTPVFDATTLEIWGPLLNGGQLVLVDKDVILEAGRLSDTLKKHRINVLWLTAPLFNRLADQDCEMFSGLDWLLVGGDVLSPRHINMVRSRNRKLKVVNGYGPTENTTFSTTYLIDKKFERDIPIGKPIGNSTAYILNNDGILQPLGVVGELCVGGDGVSRGYLNNPELTHEKFFAVYNRSPRFSRSYFSIDYPHPLLRIANTGTLYRTGDLARWLPDGSIEFTGRIDHQVKLRGFRIEPGEIEHRLLEHDYVKEVVVTVGERPSTNKSSEKYLCAYIAGSSPHGEIPGHRELRDFLSHTLPGYMIPSYFIFLEKIPLNPNGKVNRNALPQPGAIDLHEGKTAAAPGTELQKKLAKIWSEVLSIKKENIGIDDDFFALGGHSLKATVLLAQIHKELNIKIPLTEIFVTPTIRGLGEFIKEKTPGKFTPLEPVEKKEYYPLSSAQKRVYILQQLDPDSTAYNIPQNIVLTGKPGLKQRAETFGKLIRRHESLRTWFKMLEGYPVQRIREEVDFEIEYYDLAAEITVRPFDLLKAPLFRAGLLELDQDRYVLLVDMHHIVSDGLSIGILIREFLSLDNNNKLARLRIQYKDYAEWQNSTKEKMAIKKQEEFWLKEYEGEIPVLSLPVDFPRPMLKTFAGSEEIDQLDLPEAETLNRLALEEGVTWYMLMLAIFNLFLSKICCQEDIIIGTPTAGRGHADLQGIIGMFVNTLAMRNFPHGEKTFTGFLAEVKQNTLHAFENQDYQFEDLVEKVVVNRDTGRNALFSVMLALQELETEPPRKEMSAPGLKTFSFDHRISKFDITLTVVKTGNTIDLTFQYSTRLFKPGTIKRFSCYFRRVVSWILQEPHCKIGEVEILSPREKKQVLDDFNSVAVDYTARGTVIELFEQQVSRSPDHAAVIFENRQLTYGALGEKSGRLARLLISKGVIADTIVGIMVQRSIEMIVGIFAILRAGGAYLPIETDSPAARKGFLIRDSRMSILLLQKSLIPANEEVLKCLEPGRLLPMDDRSPDSHPLAKTGHKTVLDPRSLAYIIYTSGTSGNPKGVMIRHSSLTNLVLGLRDTVYARYSRHRDLKVSLLASYMFDASIKQIFATLVQGYSLFVVPKETVVDTDRLNEYYRKHGVDISDGTPTHLRLLQETIGEKKKRPNIMHFIIGGEALPGEIARGFLDCFKTPAPTVTNIYGTAECCVDSTFFEIPWENLGKQEIIPIGKPMPNCKIFILDRCHRLQPPGLPGEICIAGPGVGRGYLNRPELTYERFKIINNETLLPGVQGGDFLENIPPGRRRQMIYRTGDLGCWQPNGNLEYLGRIDQQVKIRGYRIELAEVERHLSKYPKLIDVVVLAKQEPFTKSLCAYLVSPEELTVPELRKFLVGELPEYMIPSYFFSIEKIPLTSNGKLDTRALDTLAKPLDSGVEYAAPGTDMEKIIAAAWQEVLQLEKVGIHDNFFEIGGNSLKIIRLNNRLKHILNREIPVVNLFTYPSVSSFAHYLIREGKPAILKDNHRLDALKRSQQDKLQRLQKRKNRKV